MSFLVDALKKAERERYAHRAQDIHVLSAGPGVDMAAPRGNAWLWLVAILVASNIALAIYVWRPRPASPAPAAPIIGLSSLAGLNPLFELSPDIASIDTPPARAQDAEPAEPAPEEEPAPRGQGRVTYAKAPLIDDDGGDAKKRTYYGGNAADIVTPDQSELSNVPRVNINGQLYSTVPGRGFILVDGRRYHQGERLAAGPAVESIQPDGAILRYHGQRYHVAGPG
ncbi:general secretion pathway protein GspB [Salinisphaera sp.]|uniref:general secretion pathway protein GspB n=1 Tax=Salinisphaera sp. TaxID=1914330 RepID=UPI002D76ED7A|nr:general secretion pathway protein GspB [Salinisphaera sp.]HET7315523.1 general secretion pathway protein GspB [Salinisphaera sp.]